MLESLNQNTKMQPLDHWKETLPSVRQSVSGSEVGHGRVIAPGGGPRYAARSTALLSTDACGGGVLFKIRVPPGN